MVSAVPSFNQTPERAQKSTCVFTGAFAQRIGAEPRDQTPTAQRGGQSGTCVTKIAAQIPPRIRIKAPLQNKFIRAIQSASLPIQSFQRRKHAAT